MRHFDWSIDVWDFSAQHIFERGDRAVGDGGLEGVHLNLVALKVVSLVPHGSRVT